MFFGYLAHLYATAASHPYDVLWNAIGFGGQAIFGVRFLIQWFRSEQEGHSVIPISFWYCSLIGGLISFAYSLHLQAWPLLISTGMPLPIYARNVWMIYRDRWRTAAA
jgi:lipid-A-disaccharide synthase-like uncharacterized protein